MPSFLDTVFGRKKPTATAAATELATRKVELAAIPGRIAAVEAKLKRVADLSEAEHKAAVEELGALQRALLRCGAQVDELELACAEAETVEDAAGRHVRAGAAQKNLAGLLKLFDRFDAQAAALANTAEEIKAIVDSVDAVNHESAAARKAGLDAPEPIPTPYETHWSESDTVDPDREVWDEEWFVDGRRLGGMVTTEYGGKEYPSVGGAEKRKVRRVIPGKKRPGRRMNPPIFDLCLPATRLGRAAPWPRGS